MLRCAAFVALFVVVGCAEPTTVEVSLEEVSPTEIRLRVQTGGEVVLRVEDSGAQTNTGATGVGRLVLRQGELTRLQDGALRIVAYADTLFGEKRVGDAEFELPFSIEDFASGEAGGSLRSLRRPFGRQCVNFESGPLAGLGFGPRGWILTGPAGTRIEFGETELTIPETGLLDWQATGADLLPLAELRERPLTVPMLLAVPGEAAQEAEGQVRVTEGCHGAIALHLRNVQEGNGEWQPREPSIPWIGIVRLSGSILVSRIADAPNLPQGTRFDQLALYAFESPESERPADEECVYQSHDLETASGAYAGTQSDRVTPTLITTRLTITDRPGGESLASEAFEGSGRCAREIRPQDHYLESWAYRTARLPE